MTKAVSIARIEIRDSLEVQFTCAIKVDLHLTNGERRWCWFANHKALDQFGDWVAGTRIRFHHSAPHMIVVGGELTGKLIHLALKDIAEQGDLYSATLPIE